MLDMVYVGTGGDAVVPQTGEPADYRAGYEKSRNQRKEDQRCDCFLEREGELEGIGFRAAVDALKASIAFI